MTDNERFSEEALDNLRGEIMGKMSVKRFSHTLGVEKKAEELCALFAPEKTGMMRAAALLHDITKELSTEEQLMLCKKYGIYKAGGKRQENDGLHYYFYYNILYFQAQQ